MWQVCGPSRLGIGLPPSWFAGARDFGCGPGLSRCGATTDPVVGAPAKVQNVRPLEGHELSFVSDRMNNRAVAMLANSARVPAPPNTMIRSDSTRIR